MSGRSSCCARSCLRTGDLIIGRETGCPALFSRIKKGLSVERTYDRSLEASIQFMLGHLSGNIASVTVGDCESTDAVVVYLPSLHNKYHSEIHGSAETKALNPHQARFLAERAQMVYSVSISTT